MSGRVVVAAPYPTMGGTEPAATLQRVRDLLRQGRDVHVVSPRPSAAHAHADPGSPRGAARLAALLRPTDELVLRVDGAGLAIGSDAPPLLPARLALAAAIARTGRVELIIDRVPERVSTRWVRLIAARADLVVVATDPERDALAAAGLGAPGVIVDPGILAADPTPARRGTGRLSTSGAESAAASASTPAGALSAADLEDLVRRRAAESRTPAEDAFGPGSPSLASRPLRSIPPLERPGIRSRNPAFIVVKKAELKLLAWMFDWVIQHVNRLQQATIEALDQQRAQSPKSSS